jgi:hypothetical protein
VHPAAETICHHIRVAFDYAPDEEAVEQLHPSTIAILRLMAADVAIEDLTPSEALAFRGFLSPIHARVLAARTQDGRPPRLRSVS